MRSSMREPYHGSQGVGFGHMGRFGVGSLLPRRIRRDRHVDGVMPFGHHQPGPVVAKLPLDAALRRCTSEPATHVASGKGPLPSEESDPDRKPRDMESKLLKTKGNQPAMSREDMVRGRLTSVEDYVWSLDDKLQALTKSLEEQNTQQREARDAAQRSMADLGQQIRMIRQDARQSSGGMEHVQALSNSLSQQITSLQTAQDRAQDSMSHVVGNLEGRLDAMEEAMLSKFGKLAKEQSKTSDLRNAVESLKWDAQTMKEKMVAELERKVEADLKELRNELEETRAKVAEVGEEVNMAATRHEAHRQWVIETIHTRTALVDIRKPSLPVMNEQIAELEQQVEDLAGHVRSSEHRAELQELQQALQASQHKCAELETASLQQFQDLWARISTMQPMLEDATQTAKEAWEHACELQCNLGKIHPAVEEHVGNLEVVISRQTQSMVREQMQDARTQLRKDILQHMQGDMETEVEQREDGVVDDSMHGFGAFLGLKAMLHRLSALESKVTECIATLQGSDPQSKMAQAVQQSIVKDMEGRMVRQFKVFDLELRQIRSIIDGQAVEHRTLADKVEESFGCCAHMKAELAEVKQGSAEVEVRLAKGLKAVEEVSQLASNVHNNRDCLTELEGKVAVESGQMEKMIADHSALRAKVDKVVRAHKSLVERFDSARQSEAETGADFEERLTEVQDRLTQLAEALAGTDQFSTLVTLAESIQASLESKVESEVVDTLRNQLSTAHRSVKRDLQKVDKRIGEVGQNMEQMSAAVTLTKDLISQMQQLEQRINSTETTASAAQTEMEELFGLIAAVHRKYHGQATLPAIQDASGRTWTMTPCSHFESSPPIADESSTQDERPGSHDCSHSTQDFVASTPPTRRPESLSSCGRGSSLDSSLSMEDMVSVHDLSPIPSRRQGSDVSEPLVRRGAHTPRGSQEEMKENKENGGAHVYSAPGILIDSDSTSPGLLPSTPSPQSQSSPMTSRPPRLPMSPEASAQEQPRGRQPSACQQDMAA
mmetsp:Transcript_21891/g.49923  ORF Transcript_21891/g.49923 Transcript_21891/m.49923 type:complete len:1004 (+) Transcript_21891:195-3206(+)